MSFVLKKPNFPILRILNSKEDKIKEQIYNNDKKKVWDEYEKQMIKIFISLKNYVI